MWSSLWHHHGLGSLTLGGSLPALSLQASSVCPPTRCELFLGIPGFVLEVTVCPFSWPWFPPSCGDESHWCHHVVLQRKGRAELLLVTGSTVLAMAARRCLVDGCGGVSLGLC